MRRPGLTIAAAALATAFSSTLIAQKTTEVHPGRGGSPHVKSDYTIDGAKISLTYGRPSLKGRPEAQLMPPGNPWRTGADEATILTTDKALKFGSVSLAPGSYTINTVPGAEWQIVFGKLGDKGEKQWGVPYQASLEIGRAPMKAGKTKAPVEQLTITVDDTASGGAVRIEWGGTSASAPFTVAST
jgi:hypothetical protein